jgi:uncharacterized protein YbjT (DUF2867 family)
MKIVVIGRSGRVGGNVVRRLVAQGHDPVPASPSTGVDTITGEGLPEVMAGADVVVDVSNSPAWEDDAVREFFTTSTRNLLAAERNAGVGHHVAVSIVGCDRLPDSGYLRAKAAQDAVVEAGSIPYTILRATQFFEFLPEIAAAGAERTVIGDAHARYFGTELHGGELTPGGGARIGTIDFATWWATQRR